MADLVLSAHVEESEGYTRGGDFTWWWESVLHQSVPGLPVEFRLREEPCGHAHRSERTAQQCAEKRLRKAQKEGAG